MIERFAALLEREAGHLVIALLVMAAGAFLVRCCGLPAEGRDILIAGSTLLARATGGTVASRVRRRIKPAEPKPEAKPEVPA